MMDRESLRKKIRALLAKTTGSGCTPPEALAALAKARALIDGYGVSDEELRLSKAEAAIIYREPFDARDPHQIRWFLGAGVADFCGCKIWRGSQGITFCGFRADVQFAVWLLDHLSDYVQAALVAHLICCLASGRQRRQIIKGFVLGCTGRISERLEQSCQHSTAAQADNSRALVSIKSAAIDAKIAELGIRLYKSSSRSSAINRAAHDAGQNAGDHASFGRPVSGAVLKLSNR